MMNLIQEKRAAYIDNEANEDNQGRPSSGTMVSNQDNDSQYPAQPPPPLPPSFAKHDIYGDPTVFAAIDQRAINVAQEDQKTFTDLVRQLVAGDLTDVEKARAIFRWITVKNLNSIMFEENERGDTPMGLLRGIKFGTESYHVLFKRLCR